MFENRIWFEPVLLLGGVKSLTLVNAIYFLILFLQSIIDDRLVLLLLNTLNIPKHLFTNSWCQISKDKWCKIPLHNLRKEKYLDENHWPEF